MTTRSKILRELGLVEINPDAEASPSSRILDLAVRYRDTLETLDSFLCHLNLDCCEEACTCGLDEVTDSADLPRCEQFPG